MKKLRSFWAAYFLPVDFAFATVLGIAFSFWVIKYQGGAIIDAVLKSNRAPVYGAIAAIFGSLLGFVITAVSIILGFASSERLAIVRESKHYPALWASFTSAIRWLGFATLIALVGLIFDRDDTPRHFILCLCVWAFIVATFRLIRCVWVLERVIALLVAVKKA